MANLRRNLQRYDEVVISCAEFGDEVMGAIKAMPAVMSCDYAHGKLTVGLENIQGNFIEILRVLRGHGVSISEVVTNEPTLEDIFVDTINGGGER